MAELDPGAAARRSRLLIIASLCVGVWLVLLLVMRQTSAGTVALSRPQILSAPLILRGVLLPGATWRFRITAVSHPSKEPPVQVGQERALVKPPRQDWQRFVEKEIILPCQLEKDGRLRPAEIPSPLMMDVRDPYRIYLVNAGNLRQLEQLLAHRVATQRAAHAK